MSATSKVSIFPRTGERLSLRFSCKSLRTFQSIFNSTDFSVLHEHFKMNTLPGSWPLVYISSPLPAPRWRDTGCPRSTGRAPAVAGPADNHPISSPPASRPVNSKYNLASSLADNSNHLYVCCKSNLNVLSENRGLHQSTLSSVNKFVILTK